MKKIVLIVLIILVSVAYVEADELGDYLKRLEINPDDVEFNPRVTVEMEIQKKKISEEAKIITNLSDIFLSKEDGKLVKAIMAARQSVILYPFKDNFIFYVKMLRYHYDRGEKLADNSPHVLQTFYKPFKPKNTWQDFLDYICEDYDLRMPNGIEQEKWKKEVKVFMDAL